MMAILILAGWALSLILNPEVFVRLLLVFSALSVAGGIVGVVQAMLRNRGETSQ